MHTVSFITAEDDGTDLIVSFALDDPEDSSGISTLVLIRTPKYEHLEAPEERGVAVSFERDRSWDEDGRRLLTAVRYSKPDQMVELTSSLRQYQLDVRKVDPHEIADMLKVLRKMNFDARFRLVV